MMLERGVVVSHEAIRLWCLKFGAAYARRLRHRQGRCGDTWFLDEVFCTINGQLVYLWRAVANQACRQGLCALYVRAPRLFEELNLCHADGSFPKRLAAIAKTSLLVIDDFAISPIGPRERTDLLELLDDRVGTRATLITSQLPIDNWHDYIGDPTLADAILDRLVHSAHKLRLEGETMRKRAATERQAAASKSTKID